MIKSYSHNEGEILRSIDELYLGSRGIQLDPTYSRGNIYKLNGLREPSVKLDLNPDPGFPDVERCDVRDLPFEDGSIESVLFDPPFLDGFTTGKTNKGGVTLNRFGGAYSMNELFIMYRDALVELHRVLQKKGHLIFKCQDIVSGRMNYFSHCYVMNAANAAGLYAKDLFILLNDNRMIASNWQRQFHARKYHCYYWVFSKQKIKAVNHLYGL